MSASALNSGQAVGLSSKTRHRALSIPEGPNVQDMEELAERSRDVTDILSRLLKEERWRKRLSLENSGLLDLSIRQYCAFCEATDKALAAFFDFAKLYAKLFESLKAPQSYRNIAQTARLLHSKAEEIARQLASVEARHLEDFLASVTKLLSIAPRSYLVTSSGPCLRELKTVLRRLQAFWRVVATDLFGVLECRSTPPPRDKTQLEEAERRWRGYVGFIEETQDVLMKSSDALKGISIKRDPSFGFLERIKRLFRKIACTA